MKSRSEIWLTALEELGNQCSVDTARDAETCVRRATQEGDTFFKVTLPQFAKDLERSLAAGHVPTDSFVGWARSVRNVFVVSDDSYIADNERTANQPCLHQLRAGGGNPRFLGGFLDLVFVDDRVVSESTWDGAIEWLLHEATDRKMPSHVKRSIADLLPPVLSDFVSDGLDGSKPAFITPNEEREIDEAASAIHAIRQLCLMFSKEKELPAQRDIDNEIARFVDIDNELEIPLMQSGLPGIDAEPHPVQKWAELGQQAHSDNPEVYNLDFPRPERAIDRRYTWEREELPVPNIDNTYHHLGNGVYRYSDNGVYVYQGEFIDERYARWLLARAK